MMIVLMMRMKTSMMKMNLARIGPPLEKSQSRQACMAKKTHRMKTMMMRITMVTPWRMRTSMTRKMMTVVLQTH